VGVAAGPSAAVLPRRVLPARLVFYFTPRRVPEDQLLIGGVTRPVPPADRVPAVVIATPITTRCRGYRSQHSELVRCHIWLASSLAASTAMSMARVASGDRVRPAGQCRYHVLAGDGRNWWMLSRSSDQAPELWRAIHGSTAEPMPARTIDRMLS
jgi:hypothetical protein